MLLFPVKIPNFIKAMFPNYIWELPSKEKIIYLTFDDGPTPEITTWILKTLKQYNAKATFFCLGDNVKKHPNILKTIIEEGHGIGNHSEDHPNGWFTSLKIYLKNIDTATKNFQQEAGFSPKLFRPPYGKITPCQGKSIQNNGYKIIMWTILSYDWLQNVSKETCLQNAITKTKSGSIVVFHDSEKASKNMKYALPKMLKHFSAQGFRFNSISI